MNSDIFIKQSVTSIADYLAQELGVHPLRDYRFQTLTDGPRVAVAVILVNPRYAGKIASMSEPLSMAARLDKGASVRVARGNRGTLCLEIPKPEALWYNIGVNNLPRRRGLLASVGLDSEHRPTAIDFANSLTPHVLLAGATGSGKTNCLKLLTYGLASQNTPEQVNFILIDTRKRGANWQPFAHLPHLAHPVITDNDTALRALTWACAEVDRRAQSGRKTPLVFVGVDECQDLLEQEPYVKAIGDLVGVGREFGIHFMGALQNPTAKQLGDASIKRNCTTRLVGRVDSATAAVVATGQEKTGAEKLIGSGDFLLVEPRGVKRLAAALLTSRDIENLPRSESPGALDLGEYEDVDHVLAQSDNGGKVRADDLDPRHVALALVAEKGITWLCNRLSIGSTKARRVLDFANEMRDELIAMDAYTTIPPYQNGIPDDRNGPEGDVSGMVVCRYEEVDDE